MARRTFHGHWTTSARAPRRFLRGLIAAAIALGGASSPLPAADDVWFAPVTGSWTNLAPLPMPNPPFLPGVNTWWADTTVPGAADTANFPHAGTFGVSFPAAPASIAALNLTAGNVTFASSGGEKTLTVTGTTLVSTGSLSLGTSGNPMTLSTVAANIQNGGTLNVLFDSAVASATGMAVGTAVGSSGTLSIQGTGSSASHGSLFSMAVGNTNLASAPSAINIGTVTSGAAFSTGSQLLPNTTTTINPTGSINIGSATTTGTFNANQDLVINGGVLRRIGGTFDLDDGRTMTVQNGGRAEFTGGYTTSANAVYNVDGAGSTLSTTSTLSIGAEVNVTAGGSVNGAFISVPAGELMVAGAGSSATASSAGFVIWGNGDAAAVTFTDNATGSIPGPVGLAEGDGASAMVDVTIGADLTMGSLSLASSNGVDADADVTVSGAGSTLTLNPSSTLTIGDELQGDATLRVINGAQLTVGAGGSTRLNARGLLFIDGAATVDLKTLAVHEGNVVFNSGSLSYLGNLTVGVGGLLGANLTLSSNRSLTLSGTTAVDALQALNLFGGTLNTGSLSIAGTATFTNGTLTVAPGGSVNIQSTGRLQTSLSINVPIFGIGAGSAIVVAAPGLSLGSGSSLNGFSHQGTLDVAGHTVTLNSAGYARLGSLTTLAGGAINAPNGVALAAGSNLTGSGAVNARVAGELGAVIQAGGALALGAAGSPAGFVYAGELRTLQHTVTLNSSAPASLGNLTTLGNGATPGALTATNGVVVDFGESLTGFGTVTSANLLAKRSIINGTVQGASAAQPITLTGWIKGVGTFDNVVFTGTTDLGLSPALSTVGGVTFGATNTLLIELGGTTRGSQYDAILASGQLSLGGILQVVLIDGYVPAANDLFDILDWGAIAGAFDAVHLPALGGALSWDATQLYVSGVLSVSGPQFTADFDNDGDVDAADLNNHWRPGFGPTAAADADGDGDSDGHDFLAWQQQLGSSSSPPGGAVPEPGAIALVFVASAALVRPLVRRRRR